MSSEKYLLCEQLYADSSLFLNMVATLPDGSLFTVVALTKNLAISESCTSPHSQYLYGRRSYDGGRTWGAPYFLCELEEKTACLARVGFLVSRTGSVHIFLLRILRMSMTEREVTRGDILHVRLDSPDGGNPTVRKLDCLDRYSGSLNNLIQLESGRIVVPFSTLDLEQKGSTFVSSTVYSDDDGLTWHASNDIAVVSDEEHVESGAVEPVIVETAPNTLLMIIRTVLNRFYYAVSRDGGKSWTQAEPTAITSSNAPAVLQKMPDGKILMAWNDCLGQPLRGTRYSMARQCLHAAVSDDGMKTLKGCRIVMKKVAGDPDKVLNCYPFASLANDREAYLAPFVVAGRDGESWNEPEQILLRINPEVLEPDSLQEDLCDGGANWVLNYSHSAVCEENGRRHLALRAGDGRPGFGCISFPYGRQGELHCVCRGETPLRILLSDCYLDLSNFDGSENAVKYRDIFGKPYVEFSLEKGSDFTVRWDGKEARLTTGSRTLSASMDSVCAGFNHLTILTGSREGDGADIGSFSSKATLAGLATGIEL